MEWLSKPDGGQRAAQQIFEAGGVFSTAEQEGAPRRAKACNPAGTNPADLDVTHALAAAGAAAVPTLLRALRQHTDAINRVETSEMGSETVPWAVACSAATVLGNPNAVLGVHGNTGNSDEHIVAQDVCQALARCANVLASPAYNT